MLNCEHTYSELSLYDATKQAGSSWGVVFVWGGWNVDGAQAPLTVSFGQQVLQVSVLFQNLQDLFR